MRSSIVEPKQDGRVQVEGSPQKLERVSHGLMYFLDALAGETFSGRLTGIRSLTGAEQAIVSSILADAHELRVDTRTRGCANARELETQDGEVEQPERADEGYVRL